MRRKNRTCPVCGTTFTTPFSLRCHIAAVHDKTLDHICPQCGKGFAIKSSLKLHSLTHLAKSERPPILRPHKCETCSSSFKTKTLLRYHNQSVHLVLRQFRCVLCPQTFTTQDIKKTHLIRIHTKERPYPCPHPGCGKAFINSQEMRNHGQVHIPIKDRTLHRRPHCGKGFLNKYALRRHILVKHENSGVPCPHPGCRTKFPSTSALKAHFKKCHEPNHIFCSGGGIGDSKKCGEKFKTKEALMLHLVANHEEEKGENWLNCPICKTSASSLRDHLATEHGERERSNGYKKARSLFPCDHCPKVFTTNHNLRMHFDGNHDKIKIKLTFPCAKCGKIFKTKSYLKVHSKHGHPEDGVTVRHKCPLCPVTLATKWGVLTHTNTHTGERAFKCETCHKSFRSRGDLRVHQEKSHNPSNSSIFPCPTCGIHFRNKYSLRDHIRHHVTTTEKKFNCYFCPKRFSTLSFLSQHMVTHTKELGFKCDICFQKFSTNSGLTGHKIRHAGIRKHGCYFCKKSFVTSADFMGHLRIHTREKVVICGHSGCNLRFLTNMHMRLHRWRVHDVDENKCPHCERRLRSRLGLKKHLNRLQPCC